MEVTSKTFDNLYNCVCCQTEARFPDPYSFNFGSLEAKSQNQRIFQTNQITTTKYNLINFLPKSVMLQYKRLANLYFLVVATLTSIPAISPLDPTLIWLGVVSVLGVSIIKEGYEDYSRYKIDKEINSIKTSLVLREGRLVDIPWGQIIVGDICLIKEGEYFPADLILLSSCQNDGISYIETASLDGEKTSKIRYAFQALSMKYKTEEDLINLKGSFNGQNPSLSLEQFQASMTIDGNKYDMVDCKQLLYRGSKLMNTEKVWGLVAYAGQCSKIMLNSQKSNSKISGVEKRVNVMLMCLFFAQVIICILMASLSIHTSQQLKAKAYYLDLSEVANYSTFKEFIINFLMYFIDNSTIIPISLMVTVEMVKLAQSYFIDFDQLMYSDIKERKVLAKNTTLNEELGQIEYVFTDKTGTLTSNKMTFHTAVIGKRMFEFEPSSDAETYKSAYFQDLLSSSQFATLSVPLELFSDDGQQRVVLRVEQQLIHHYFMALLVCNTINVVEREGLRIYQSESPDELAIIKFIKSMKYVFVKRQQSVIHAEIYGKSLSIKILEKFSFSSDRKRMSVIVDVNNQLWLYTKGADNVISERMVPSNFSFDSSISDLSRKGLRTLLVGMKAISLEQYKEYQEIIKQTSLANREKVVSENANKFENNLTVVGATALLDELQEGVPQTLRDLQRADIKVWMLTGDKLETAVEVGKSCNLINRNYEIIESRPGKDKIQDEINKWEQKIANEKASKFSLVIEGSRLSEIIGNQQLQKRFAKLSQGLTTVICCRLLPIQKAQIVSMIRQNLGKICLAIGDGGNDVSMLKEAHIGVGLYGEEGMSAVQASDYAVPQFRMIWRLLFVHGRWNYLRVSELILYFTYKSILFTMPRLVFSYFSAFSGQPVYDDYYIALYNVVFTSVPLLVRALFEQDVNYVVKDVEKKQQPPIHDIPSFVQKNCILSQKESKYLPKGYKIQPLLKWKFPKIYYVGKDHQFFNVKVSAIWILQSIILGVVGTFLVLYMIGTRAINQGGYTSDLWMCSITVYTIVIVVSSIKIFMHVQHITLLFMFSLLGCSVIPYFAYMWVSNFILNQYVDRTVQMCLRTPYTYCVILFVCVLAVISISIFVYFTFHRNKSVKKIRLNMQQEMKIQCEQTISTNSYMIESNYYLDQGLTMKKFCSSSYLKDRKISIEQIV